MGRVHSNPGLPFRGARNVVINNSTFCIIHFFLLAGLVLQGTDILKKKKRCIHLLSSITIKTQKNVGDRESRRSKKWGGGGEKRKHQLYCLARESRVRRSEIKAKKDVHSP